MDKSSKWAVYQGSIWLVSALEVCLQNESCTFTSVSVLVPIDWVGAELIQSLLEQRRHQTSGVGRGDEIEQGNYFDKVVTLI